MLSMQDDSELVTSAMATSASTYQRMRACSTHFDPLMRSSVGLSLQSEERTVTREKDDEYQLLRHVILLLILSLSMLVVSKANIVKAPLFFLQRSLSDPSDKKKDQII